MKRMLCLSAWVGSLALVASGCAATSDRAQVAPAEQIQLSPDGSEFNNLFQDGEMFFAGQPTEDGLRDIAGMTGGQYFRATDTEALREIYRQIDAMEKTEVEVKEYTEYNELFLWFLLPALFLLLLEIVLANTRFMKIP